MSYNLFESAVLARAVASKLSQMPVEFTKKDWDEKARETGVKMPRGNYVLPMPRFNVISHVLTHTRTEEFEIERYCETCSRDTIEKAFKEVTYRYPASQGYYPISLEEANYQSGATYYYYKVGQKIKAKRYYYTVNWDAAKAWLGLEG